jgi:hypothetical protein
MADASAVVAIRMLVITTSQTDQTLGAQLLAQELAEILQGFRNPEI